MQEGRQEREEEGKKEGRRRKGSQGRRETCRAEHTLPEVALQGAKEAVAERELAGLGGGAGVPMTGLTRRHVPISSLPGGGLAKGARVGVILLCVYVYDHERWECPFSLVGLVVLLLAVDVYRPRKEESQPLLDASCVSHDQESFPRIAPSSHPSTPDICPALIPSNAQLFVEREPSHFSPFTNCRVRYGTYSSPTNPTAAVK